MFSPAQRQFPPHNEHVAVCILFRLPPDYSPSDMIAVNNIMSTVMVRKLSFVFCSQESGSLSELYCVCYLWI